MGVSTKITQIRTYGGYAMTGNKCKASRINLQEIFGADRDSFKVFTVGWSRPPCLIVMIHGSNSKEMMGTTTSGGKTRWSGLSLRPD